MHVILFQMRAPLLTLLVISALLVTGSDAWGWRRVWRRVVRVRGWGRERDRESDRQTDREVCTCTYRWGWAWWAVEAR